MDIFTGIIGFAAGFALCWFAKDKITAMVTGSQALAAKLEAKAQALRAAL